MGAERWDEQVGSVADEAARLLDSLRRSVEEPASSGTPGGTSDEPEQAGGAKGDGRHRGGRSSGDPQEVDDSSADADGSSSRTGGAEAQGHPHDADGVPHDPFCTWCPLCRSAAVVRSLSPQTLSRLAELAGLAASVLADLATSRAAPSGEPPASGPAPEPEGSGKHPDAGNPPPPGGFPGRSTGPRRPAPAPARAIPVRDADDPQEGPRG